MIKITKLKQIDESEARTNNILKDPKFTSWFNGSKVVDSNGNPLVCYHGTKTQFKNFKVLSHFGTSLAANNFVDDKFREPSFHNNWTTNGDGDRIVPVYLSIKNPLKIEDGNNTGSDIAIDLYNQDLISWKELLEICPTLLSKLERLSKSNNVSLETYKNDGNEIVQNLGMASLKTSSAKIISIFKQKGYDGFYYTNNIEDTGSTSWIIFNSNQVWPIYQNKPDRNSERKR